MRAHENTSEQARCAARTTRRILRRNVTPRTNYRRRLPRVFLSSGIVNGTVFKSFRSLTTLCASAALLASTGCGGAQTSPAAHAEGTIPSPHACGDETTLHHHEIDPDAPGETEAFVPCSRSGAHDYSGVVHVESEPEGLRITIDATDDDFKEGVFGSDLKGRDAVLVYPKGRGAKAVEVPLVRSAHGYHGEKVLSYDQLDKLNDEGTKIEIGVFDHDEGAKAHEELHVQVHVSTGTSCEKAVDDNPQRVDLGDQHGAGPDLTDDQLSAPIQNSAFFSNCALDDSAKANICVAIKNGTPLGVTVQVNPSNKRIAACIDRATRKLSWPSNAKLDVVHQTF
jgi:hypothetical protein